MFFDSWADLLEVGVSAVAAYASLVLLLRISGKRTLAKMNAFDLVVTVALGSALAAVILTKEVSISEGVLAFAVLIGLQFVVAWLSVRSRALREVVKSEPALLFFQGRYLEDALRRQRVAREEVRSAIRAAGAASLSEVEAVVLETDGTFSVVRGRAEGAGSLLDVEDALHEASRARKAAPA